MGKLTYLVAVPVLACLLIPGCKSTPAQPPAGASTPQASSQTAQPPAPAAPATAQPLAPAVRSAVRSVNAVYTRSVRPVVSAPFEFVVNKARQLGSMKVRLFGVTLPPTELLAIILAAVILVVGGTWTLSSMSRRR